VQHLPSLKVQLQLCSLVTRPATQAQHSVRAEYDTVVHSLVGLQRQLITRLHWSPRCLSPILEYYFFGCCAFAPRNSIPAATAVTLGGPMLIPRGNAPSFTVTDPLTIIDPIDSSSNVGRNCFRFGQVQQVLRDAWTSLSQVAAQTSWNEDTLSMPIPGSHTTGRRFRMERLGCQHPAQPSIHACRVSSAIWFHPVTSSAGDSCAN